MEHDADAALADAFLEYLWLRERLAQNTLDAYRRDLAKLSAALADGGQDLASADSEALAAAVHAGGAASTQARMLSAAKRFYGWLHETEQRGDNPCAALKAAKQPQRLPVLVSEAQIDALLAAPDVADPFGLRDKALLELVYATGLRASEAVGLTLNDVGLERGIVHTVGKGGKPRIVPLGAEAAHWLERYLAEARGQILKGRRCDALFVGNKKTAISRQLAWQIVRRYTEAVGIEGLSPHGLRHAFATHMLNHGADLRVLQLLLGHADITTTQIYTHVADLRLQEIVKRHHPRS